ncbi:hypothetical protein H8E88_31665 [candidate division KSB1 bacterium]|nr:hypothetical protein [candidate division KSB1 bacterium]
MIEVLLSAVVYPIAKKVGERWIDRFVEGIDEKLVHLMKKAIIEDKERGKVIEYIQNNRTLEAKLKDNIQSVMEEDTTTNALAASIPPTPGKKLFYHKKFLEWISNTCVRFKRQVVLKGFLNGTEFLSYFVIDAFDSKVEMSQIRDSYIRPRHGLNIYIEKIASQEDMNEKFRNLNRKIRLSKRGSMEYKDYKNLNKLNVIHENWVQYDSFKINDDFLKLSNEMQDECEIKEYTAIKTMIVSLRELIDLEQKDIKEIDNALGSMKL